MRLKRPVFILGFLLIMSTVVPAPKRPTKKVLERSFSFKKITVENSREVTPLVQVINSGNSTDSRFKWLLVDVSYYPPKISEDNNVRWLDDITMTVEVMLPLRHKGKRIIGAFTGKIEFWSIPMDGKKHIARACIAPRAIGRYAFDGNRIKLRDIKARVSFYDKNRKLLGRGFSLVAGSSPIKVAHSFARYLGSAQRQLIIKDTVLPRNKTPWLFVNYDYYDWLKP